MSGKGRSLGVSMKILISRCYPGGSAIRVQGGRPAVDSKTGAMRMGIPSHSSIVAGGPDKEYRDGLGATRWSCQSARRSKIGNEQSPSVQWPNGTDDGQSLPAQPVTSETGISASGFLVPVRGYDKGCSAENVESAGIAADPEVQTQQESATR